MWARWSEGVGKHFSKPDISKYQQVGSSEFPTSPAPAVVLTSRSRELDGHQRTQVAVDVRVRVEVRGESSGRVIFDVTDDFSVCAVLPAARNPNLIAVALGEAADVIYEVLRHIFGQVLRVVEVLGHPVENAIEFQEEAGRRVVVSIGVLRGARAEFADVELADLIFVRKRVEVAVLLVGLAVRVL